MKALAENLATIAQVETSSQRLANVLNDGKRMGRTQERVRVGYTQQQRETECAAAKAASRTVNVRLVLKTHEGNVRFVYRKGELVEFEGVQPAGVK